MKIKVKCKLDQETQQGMGAEKKETKRYLLSSHCEVHNMFMFLYHVDFQAISLLSKIAHSCGNQGWSGKGSFCLQSLFSFPPKALLSWSTNDHHSDHYYHLIRCDNLIRSDHLILFLIWSSSDSDHHMQVPDFSDCCIICVGSTGAGKSSTVGGNNFYHYLERYSVFKNMN